MSLIHMIILITCLRDPKSCWKSKLDLNLKFLTSVKCGPLSSVVDFSELSGMELDYSPKRYIVPDIMFYKCPNLHKIGSYGSICFKGPNRAIQHNFQTRISAVFT
jgi:hypothetical protein